MKNQNKILLGVLGVIIVGAVIWGSANSSMFQGFLHLKDIKKVEVVEPSINRAEFAKYLVDSFNLEDRLDEWAGCRVYPDVANDSWYWNPVCTVNSLGLMSGYDDGTFRPLGTITRAEAAKAIHTAAGVEYGCALPKLFSDIVKDDWYYDAVNQLGAYNFFDVETPIGSKFKPNNELTRAAAAQWFGNASVLQ